MQHNTAFHQGLYFLLIRDRKRYNLETSTCDPLDVQNGQPHNYCINMFGKIHRNTKGFLTNVFLLTVRFFYMEVDLLLIRFSVILEISIDLIHHKICYMSDHTRNKCYIYDLLQMWSSTAPATVTLDQQKYHSESRGYKDTGL